MPPLPSGYGGQGKGFPRCIPPPLPRGYGAASKTRKARRLVIEAEAIAEKPRRKPPERGKAGGRPHRATLRLTEDERAVLEGRATEAGLSVASYLRAAALGQSGPRARRRPTVERAALIAATAELNRVGNNVNQLARAINRGREADVLAETLAELRGVLAVVRDAFRA